jgi:zinc transport system substrate-binding protein
MSGSYMKKPLALIALVTLIIIAIAATFFWNTPPQTDRRLAATIFPLADIAQNIAGDDWEIITLIPPGQSPHTYEPLPGDVRALSTSRAVFAIGYGLDDWVSSLAQNAGVDSIITVDTNIPLMDYDEDEDGDHDDEDADAVNHYWLSVENAKIIAANIATYLITIDPENENQYLANLERYQAELAKLKLEGDLKRQESGINSIATFHNAWTYFAREYDLDIVAVFEPFPGQEPSPAYLGHFYNQIRRHNLTVVYTEPQFNPAALRSLTTDLNLNYRELDPLGGAGDRDSYINLMKFNFNQVFTQD